MSLIKNSAEYEEHFGINQGMEDPMIGGDSNLEYHEAKERTYELNSFQHEPSSE